MNWREVRKMNREEWLKILDKYNELFSNHFHEDIDARDKWYFRVMFEDCRITRNKNSKFDGCHFQSCKYREE